MEAGMKTPEQFREEITALVGRFNEALGERHALQRQHDLDINLIEGHSDAYHEFARATTTREQCLEMAVKLAFEAVNSGCSKTEVNRWFRNMAEWSDLDFLL
jgi:hypothetical protein